jgi:hypothetical protein
MKKYLLASALLAVLMAVAIWPKHELSSEYNKQTDDVSTDKPVTASKKENKKQFREQPAASFDTPAGDGRLAMTMHRLRAGDPDDDGWCLAESTEGGFSVKLPSVFNDFTMSNKTANGGIVKFHAIGTVTQAGTKYAASAITSTDPMVKADLLSDFGKSFDGVLERRSISHAGLNGIHMRVRSTAWTALFRIFQKGRTLYLLGVEHQTSPIMSQEIEQCAIIFFDSFKLGE